MGSDPSEVQTPASPAPHPALPEPWEVSAPQDHAYQGVDELSPGLARTPDSQSRAILCRRKERVSMSFRAASTHPSYPTEQLVEQAGGKKTQPNTPPKKPQEALPLSRLAR